MILKLIYLKLSNRAQKSSKSNCELFGVMGELFISLGVGSIILGGVLKQNNKNYI